MVDRPSPSPTTSCWPWTSSRRRSRWRASPTRSAATSSATPCGGACRSRPARPGRRPARRHPDRRPVGRRLHRRASPRRRPRRPHRAGGRRHERRAAPVEHGFPARLVVAGLYGYVSATKWLTAIELTRLEDVDGYWVRAGLGEGGADQAPVAHRRAPLRRRRPAGAGDGGRRGVGAGHRHQRGRGAGRRRPVGAAELGDVASKDTWVQWRHPFDLAPGQHVVAVRADDAKGRCRPTASSRPSPTAPPATTTAASRWCSPKQVEWPRLRRGFRW